MMEKAIFIDKDGTLIQDIPYNADPEKIRLEHRAAEALKRWRSHGYLIIVISNQSGIAKGKFSTHDLDGAVAKVKSLLALEGASIDDFYYCPHHKKGIIEEFTADCDCRKPKPGLIVKAANEWNVDLHSSWMIGDILNDVEAGNQAGCRTILIDNGNETEWQLTETRTPLFIVSDLGRAAEKILQVESIPYV